MSLSQLSLSNDAPLSKTSGASRRSVRPTREFHRLIEELVQVEATQSTSATALPAPSPATFCGTAWAVATGPADATAPSSVVEMNRTSPAAMAPDEIWNAQPESANENGAIAVQGWTTEPQPVPSRPGSLVEKKLLEELRERLLEMLMPYLNLLAQLYRA